MCLMDSDAPSRQVQSLPTALIVDDSTAARDIFSIVLQRLGYRIVEADDGAKALAVLEKDTFDLVVLDLKMDMVDGSVVLQFIRSNQKSKDATVVVTTAHPSLVTTDVGASANRVMYKPINVQEFMGYVRGLRRLNQ
jgi:DNA-binding response OmpR family regulator